MYKLKIQENKSLSDEKAADYDRFKYISLAFSSFALAIFITYTQKITLIFLAGVLLLISCTLLLYKQVQLKQYKDYVIALIFIILSIATAILFMLL